MIDLMKHTYMMEPEKVQEDLDRLWNRYQSIVNKSNPSWEEVNEARATLFLTGQIYCEKIAVEAIERRLHLLKEKLSLIDFFCLIDKNSERLEELRKDELFNKLEKFYRIIKKYKNRYNEGKYYLDEERFIKKYGDTNPKKELKMGYRGSF
ncbi:MAG: hypothetical protein KJ939_01605 [Nanoarchaeota archaeon]|nr:hypothetical protein [Nanoarchaeota archaeon]MBU4351756.1 hypothetical protein [Nanoarchaeota archaeon]